LSERILADAVMDAPEIKAKSKNKAAAKARKKGKSATVNGRRAAFTLRLDPDRHLKLRLAATMQGISAQAIVTEALDQMLDNIDGLDGLAERMKRN
jgi:predicted HicB family RNase H-like nuclease